MTPIEIALEYARTHLQPVRICYINRHTEVCGAVEAVALCTDKPASSQIVGVVAKDSLLTNMLNQLLDSEYIFGE